MDKQKAAIQIKDINGYIYHLTSIELLPAGTYIISIKNGKKIYTKRIDIVKE